MSSNNKIFIQIAAYRDPQLVPTVQDCIANAKWPENLVFCIAWQHAPDEKINEIKNLPNVKIIDIPYMESKGACWARNRIQQEYDGEEYYFMYLGTDGGYHEYFDLSKGEWQKGVLDHGCLCLYVHEEEQ